MLVDLLKDIVSYVAGPAAVDIVDLLHGKENVNEFLIAKKLQVTINQARNILYKLGDEGLVSFIRKKDKKNGGWYTYFWTLDVEKSLVALQRRLNHESEQLNHELHRRQTVRFYYSPSADIEYSEEKALEYDFICPETGEVMELKDTSERVQEIETRITELSTKLETVAAELAIIHKKQVASKERKQRALEKKKKAEREARKKAREREKKREAAKLARKKGAKRTAKNTAKKSVKKKPAKKAAKKSPVRKKSVVKKKPTTKKKTVKKSSPKKISSAKKTVKRSSRKK